MTALRKPPLQCALAALAAVAGVQTSAADGVVVDRIYDPYVQPLEKEVEWRSVLQSDKDLPDMQRHALGFGRSLSDRWSAELYAIGTKTSGENLDVDAFEVEFKWQLTEQGEFAFDWGMVFELEREVDEDVWEAGVTLVSARDFARWSAIANLGLIYEWGSGVEEEFETELHLQARYRYKETFEPAIELHAGQDTTALGPAFTGLYRLSPGKKLRWSAGIFWGLEDDSPDRIFKLNLEYEF